MPSGNEITVEGESVTSVQIKTRKTGNKFYLASEFSAPVTVELKPMQYWRKDIFIHAPPLHSVYVEFVELRCPTILHIFCKLIIYCYLININR